MHRLSLTLMLLACAAVLRAEEPGSIYLPGSEDLDDAGKALFKRGNDDVKASYHALLDKNDPEEAERLMQEALAIIGTLGAQIGDSGPGGNKVGIYGNAKKNRNVVETSGGLDGIAEMEMKNLTTVTDYDFHLHHRAVLANFTSQAKDIVALQKFIIKEIYAAGNTKSYTGGNAQQNKHEKHEKKDEKQEQKDDDTQTGPRRMATPGGAQDQDQQQQKKQNGGQTQSALLPSDKPQQDQKDPTQKNADAKDQNGKPSPDQGEKPANPEGAKAPLPPQLPSGQDQKAPNAGGTPNPGQPNPDGTPNPDSGTPLSPEQLAQKQDQVANTLNNMAEKLREQGGQKDTADAFRHAADQAKAAAAAIRSGDKLAAANAAAAAENAMKQAFAQANGEGEQERQAQTAALVSAVSSIQERQAQVVTDAKKLKDAVAAGTVSKEDAGAQGSKLADLQADLKQDIDALSQSIDTQAKAAPDSTSPNAQAVQEGLRAAASALHEGRASQEAVNSTVNLRQGHTDQALSAIARETTALDQAHARLSAAADAAAGGHGSDKQALGDLQALSTALRQLSKTAQAAIDGQGQGDAKKPDQTGDDARKDGEQGKNGEQAKHGATAKNEDAQQSSDPHANPNGTPPAQLPAELGNAIDSSLKELSKQVDEQLKNMPQASAQQKARISALTRQRLPIAKDPGATLEHMSSLVAEVEGLEADLAKKISQDQGHAALQTFLKDPVPAAYRSSVADYYQLLADDMSMSSSAAPAPAPAAAPAPVKVSP